MLLTLRTHFPCIPLRRRAATHLRRSSTITMSSSTPPPNQIIEHVVLFRANPAASPAAVSAMLANLNSLSSLPPVLHLSAAPVRRSAGPLSFTHLLHSRYRSIPDLQTYSDHPTHVAVVQNYVSPVVDDVMAVDWVADGVDSAAAVVPPGAAVRLTALRMREGVGEEGRSEVLGVVGGVKGRFDSIEQMTVGENFSPGRSKGFEVCSIAVFKGLEEMEGEMEKEKEKVRGFVDGVLVVDFVVGGAAVGSGGAAL